MRLADFILQEMETIVAEWEAFAATRVPAATGLSAAALRDHAHQILNAVAKDLRTPQTRHEQSEKSRGNAPVIEAAPETAAQTHAVLRARAGFDINQLVAEYRALRSSVLRLWIDAGPLDAISVEAVANANVLDITATSTDAAATSAVPAPCASFAPVPDLTREPRQNSCW